MIAFIALAKLVLAYLSGLSAGVAFHQAINAIGQAVRGITNGTRKDTGTEQLRHTTRIIMGKQGKRLIIRGAERSGYSRPPEWVSRPVHKESRSNRRAKVQARQTRVNWHRQINMPMKPKT